MRTPHRSARTPTRLNTTPLTLVFRPPTARAPDIPYVCNTHYFQILMMIFILFTVTTHANRWWATTQKSNKKAQLSLTNPRDVKGKPAKNCSNSTCLQRCRRQYWPIFMRLAAVTSEICEIPRNSLKIQTYEVQSHPRSSILVPIESPYVTCN